MKQLMRDSLLLPILQETDLHFPIIEKERKKKKKEIINKFDIRSEFRISRVNPESWKSYVQSYSLQ